MLQMILLILQNVIMKTNNREMDKQIKITELKHMFLLILNKEVKNEHIL